MERERDMTRKLKQALEELLTNLKSCRGHDTASISDVRLTIEGVLAQQKEIELIKSALIEKAGIILPQDAHPGATILAGLTEAEKRQLCL